MALKNQDESLFSGIKFRANGLPVEDRRDENSNGFDNLRQRLTNSRNYNHEGKADKVSSHDDIVNLLPSDPFDLSKDIIRARMTAIATWIEDFGIKNLEFESSSEDEDEDENNEVGTVDDQFLAEVNIVLNCSTSLHPGMGDIKTDEESSISSNELGICDDPSIEDWTPWDAAHYHIATSPVKNVSDGVQGSPPDALFFALGYLDMRDLLSVERVCKSLRDAVQNDPLLWQNFHVPYPLGIEMTDDTLLRLTSRAQGTLRSLNIAQCLNITDGGLKRVLEMNTKLTKLSIAGCIRLKIEGALSNLRFFKSVGRPGIKQLRVGGLCGTTNQHFEELKLLLGAENQNQVSAHKPRFFHTGRLYLSFDDERPIDIEICPRCQQLTQVYDCPTDSCRGKRHTAQACKACTLCIARCINCGRCLHNYDYEETFHLDLLCFDCVKQVLNCQDIQNTVTYPPKYTYCNQQASYHLFLYG